MIICLGIYFAAIIKGWGSKLNALGGGGLDVGLFYFLVLYRVGISVYRRPGHLLAGGKGGDFNKPGY